MPDMLATIATGSRISIDGVEVVGLAPCGCCAGVWRARMDGDMPDVIVREGDLALARAWGEYRTRVLVVERVKT